MTGQTNFLQALGWAVVNSLWQMALLWVIYQLFVAVFRKSGAAVRSNVAATLVLSGFGWFIYSFIAMLFGTTAPVITSFVPDTGTESETINAWLVDNLPVASLLYLFLLLFPIHRFIRNYRYVQVIRKEGLSRIDVSWRMFVSRISSQLTIRRTVRIWVSEFVASPVTIGFLKPVILVPIAAISQLTPQQVEAVLLHELAHIRRSDYLVNLLINFAQTILYFNPFVRAFVKIVEREREKACDELVLQFQYEAHNYASALLQLEKNRQEAMTIGATGKRHDLLSRVERIMGVDKTPIFSFHRMAGVLVAICCIFLLNTLVMITRNKATGTAAASAFAYQLPFSKLQVNENSHADYVFENRAGKPSHNELNPTIIHRATVKNSTREQAGSAAGNFAEYVSAAVNPDIINASLDAVQLPELKKYQEDQVKTAIAASKKVLENVQWKAVEKSIADAFDQQEKEELKRDYEQQVEKFNWKKWEDNLKAAYDQIDWERINSQLSTAVTQVRLDSIQYVYNKALSKLDGARKELATGQLKGIPDTDITLKQIENKKEEIQRALTELKAARVKKIVHL